MCPVSAGSVLMLLDVKWISSTTQSYAVDDFLSNILQPLLDSTALLAHVDPLAVCLVSLTGNKISRDSIRQLFPVIQIFPNANSAASTSAYQILSASLSDPNRFSSTDPAMIFYNQDVVQQTLVSPLQAGTSCLNDCLAAFGEYGSCVAGVCVCIEGQWAGPDCSIPTCPGIPACSNNGQCLLSFTKAPLHRCACRPEWDGLACNIPLCINNCSGHGICNSNGLNPLCVCDSPWGGSDCSTEQTVNTNKNTSWFRWATMGLGIGAAVFVMLSMVLYELSKREILFGPIYKTLSKPSRVPVRPAFPSHSSNSTASRSTA